MAALMTRHSPKAWRIVMRYLGSELWAEDVLQEAFVKVWTKAESFDPQKAQFTTWFTTIVIRLCLDQLRRQKPTTDITQGALNLIDPSLAADKALGQSQEDQSLRQMILELAPAQRDALILCYYEALPQAEVAKILGLHLKALEGVLHRAKLKLKPRLVDYYGASPFRS